MTTNRIRFRCLESVLGPVELRSLSVYHCETIKKGFTVDSPWLSGLDTIAESAHGGVFRNTNYHGNKITIHGRMYERGLLMHPDEVTNTAVFEFDLAQYPKAKGIKAIVGIDDSTQGKGQQFPVAPNAF